MPFASIAANAIEAFAANMGLPFRPAQDGSVTFEFEQSGSLCFTPAADSRVLISLARRPDSAAQQAEAGALEWAGLDPSSGAQSHAGLAADGSLVLVMAFEPDDLTVQAIDMCFDALRNAHSAISRGR